MIILTVFVTKKLTLNMNSYKLIIIDKVQIFHIKLRAYGFHAGEGAYGKIFKK